MQRHEISNISGKTLYFSCRRGGLRSGESFIVTDRLSALMIQYQVDGKIAVERLSAPLIREYCGGK